MVFTDRKLINKIADEILQDVINSVIRVTHICVSKLTITGSDNGLLPDRRQAIIWTNAGILLTGPLKTNFGEIFIKIHTFSFTKRHLKMSSAKWQPFCLGLNVLTRVSVFLIILKSRQCTKWRHSFSQPRYQNKAVCNKMNHGYFSLAATVLKPQQIPMFLHISARVWGRLWSPHTPEEKGSLLKPQ